MRLTLPWPPSANTYWRHITRGPQAGRTLISEKGRAYRAEIIALVASLRAGKQLAGLLTVDALCFVPDRRRRDLGNLEKALFDSLTHAGVWLDDSQVDDMRFRRARTSEGELILGGRIEITIQAVGGKS